MQETNTLKARVEKVLRDSILEWKSSDSNLKIRIEYSRDERFGDYSTPFLMENKETLGPPLDNSKQIIPILERSELFEKVDFTMPGFINFKISKKTLNSYLFQIAEKDIFPELTKPLKIIFEFVSANPTGPLNIVSARAAAMGDIICNLLQKVGHKVHREFYVNDFGNQVFLLGVACLARLREALGETLTFQEEGDNTEISILLEKNILPSESYRGEYIKEISSALYSEPEKKKIIDELLQNKEYEKLSNQFSIWAVSFNLEKQKKDLAAFGVHFDEFFSERSLHEKGEVIEVLKYLKPYLKTEGEKISFLSTEFGDDKDRVVVREDGRPTYLLADICYHKTKVDRGFQKIINIWGPDHHGYITRLSGAMQALGLDKDSFQVLIAQQVNLLSKGEKLKMSKRLGQFQTMSDLIEFLGENYKDVGRYFFIARSLETPLDFDLDLAKEESEKNPVYYLQYAHARIQSIFREIGSKGKKEDFETLEYTEERRRLSVLIAKFPEEILDAAKLFEPHRLANYLKNLAKAFTQVYSAKENRLKDADSGTQSGLAFLLATTAICLSSGLEILGINAPERMERT
ncbi:MAG: arginine--tRNA ligase [Leptospiraceae bacterium]|nr:arginine--tRNA ligase [Leptospiraceae bacterium]